VVDLRQQAHRFLGGAVEGWSRSMSWFAAVRW
jgi:hypothetical protein